MSEPQTPPTTTDQPTTEEPVVEVAPKAVPPLLAILKEREGQISELIGGGPERLARFTASFIAAIPRTKHLGECTPSSFIRAVHKCAMLRLEPGPLDEMYLIPYRNNKRKGRPYEVDARIGYKGLMEMAKRHPDVRQVECDLVYAGDEYELDIAKKILVHHSPLDGDRSSERIIGGYSRVWLHGSDVPLIFEMNKQQVEERHAKAMTQDFWGPWYAPMFRKTIIRAHYNGGSVPRTTELALAIQQDYDEEKLRQVPATVTASAAFDDAFGDLEEDEQPPTMDPENAREVEHETVTTIPDTEADASAVHVREALTLLAQERSMAHGAGEADDLYDDALQGILEHYKRDTLDDLGPMELASIRARLREDLAKLRVVE